MSPYGESIDQYEDDEYKNKTFNVQASYSFDENNKIELMYTAIDAKGDADSYNQAIGSFDPNGEYHLESKSKYSKINFNHIDNFNELNIYAQRSDFSRYYHDDSYSQHFDGKIDEYGINSKIPYREKDFIIVGIDKKDYKHQNDIDRSYDSTGFLLPIATHSKALSEAQLSLLNHSVTINTVYLMVKLQGKLV